jgi:hypothetical protein
LTDGGRPGETGDHVLCWQPASSTERSIAALEAEFWMSVVGNEPSPAVSAHPEEIKSTFDLRVGEHIVLQASARITPAGVICTGIAVATVMLSIAYLVSATRRRPG